MNDRSIKWSVAITAAWLVIIALFWFLVDLESPKSLNELGDALAGIFAPVAFLWLVLGYRQQGKQLEQNTKALEQQEKALQLQIDEMKENVKYQKQLGDIQRDQFESIVKSVEPILKFSGSFIREDIQEIYDYDKYGNIIDLIHSYEVIDVHSYIENRGKDARKLKIVCDDGTNFYLIEVVDGKDKKEISFRLTDRHHQILSKEHELTLTCQLVYENIYGRIITKKLYVKMYKDNNGAYMASLHIVS